MNNLLKMLRKSNSFSSVWVKFVKCWPTLSQPFILTFRFIIYAVLPLLHPTPPFVVYFYIKFTIHFYLAAYKCTIKELVVCNHRMWHKANSEQLLTCQLVTLHDSTTPQLNPTPLPPPNPPKWWNKQEEERKQVIHKSDTNLSQQIHNRSHWVLGCNHPLSVWLLQTCWCLL